MDSVEILQEYGDCENLEEPVPILNLGGRGQSSFPGRSSTSPGGWSLNNNTLCKYTALLTLPISSCGPRGLESLEC